MTDTDISPEAVERLRTSMRIGHSSTVDAERMILALSAALTQSRAETAAAYERAAREADVFVQMRERQIAQEKAKAALHIDVPQVMRWQAGKVQSDAIAENIRVLATPDQKSALDRMIAEAEARGMERAAEIARALGMTELETSVTPIGPRTQAFYAAHDAILAAAKKGGA